MADLNFDDVFKEAISAALNGAKPKTKQLSENDALVMAKNMKISFDAFIKVGFTEAQAFTIMQMVFKDGTAQIKY